MPFRAGYACALLCCATLAAALPLGAAQAKSKVIVLHAFAGGSDGRGPAAALIADKAGNLYGTTAFGGSGVGCYGGNEGRGCGTVFKVAPGGATTVLHAFTGGSDGYEPQSSLIADKSGTLYGTTAHGGGGCGHDGCGTVYKIAPDGTETVLYVFKSGSDGAHPFGGLVADKRGNLYGVTPVGGGTATCGNLEDQQTAGCGVVFKLTPNGTETILHAFTGGSDGGAPIGNLIIDAGGNLYGTAGAAGGSADCSSILFGCGVAFKLAPNGTETVLHVFSGGADGAYPASGLIMDDSGNLYGTTGGGGGGSTHCGYGSILAGCGTVFKIAPDGTETLLWVFTGGADGAYPLGGLAIDAAGNLYGTTGGGGGKTNCTYGPYGCGVIFAIAPGGTETILHVFTGKKGDGAYPAASPILGKKGFLYGTTYHGGMKSQHGYGTVFKVKS